MGLVLAATLGGCGKSDELKPGEEGAPAEQHNQAGKDAANAEAGLKAVTNRNCAKCHSQDMSGSQQPLGDQSRGIELYPPNLTNDDTGIGKWSDDQLANAIRLGYDRHGLVLCPQMKHESTMSDYEAFSIVKYLRSLPPKQNLVKRSVCPPLKTKEEQSQSR
jgi:cytochrome c